MHVLIKVLSVSKQGNNPEENEDASYPHRGGEYDVDFFQLAIADGATETSFSGLWARMLVDAYCHGKFAPGKLWRHIDRLRHQWLRTVKSKSLPWYAEEKLKMGAYSSLIGLTVHASSKRSEIPLCEGLAIGDSCLFQVRNNELILKWPIDHSSMFGYHPVLLSTKFAPDEESSEQRKQGEWLTGDLFYLMTDAIAQWYLKSIEQGAAPGRVIPNFESNDSSLQFSQWIQDLRNSGEIRNDDVTLVLLCLT